MCVCAQYKMERNILTWEINFEAAYLPQMYGYIDKPTKALIWSQD